MVSFLSAIIFSWLSVSSSICFFNTFSLMFNNFHFGRYASWVVYCYGTSLIMILNNSLHFSSNFVVFNDISSLRYFPYCFSYDLGDFIVELSLIFYGLVFKCHFKLLSILFVYFFSDIFDPFVLFVLIILTVLLLCLWLFYSYYTMIAAYS